MNNFAAEAAEAAKKRKIEGSGEDRRSTFASCPCYLKLLVNNIAAGSIIGKNGSEIAAIEQNTGVFIKLSPAGKYYPTTQERVVVMGGTEENLIAGLHLIMAKVSSSMASTDEPSALKCRLIVPNSAVSCIIGRQGQSIKQLQEQTGARAQISQRDDNMKERIVNISGNMQQIISAVSTISSAIQSDPNVAEHINVLYTESPTMHAAAPIPSVSHSISDPYGGMYGPPSYAYRPYPYDPYGGSSPYVPSASASPDVMNTPCEIEVHVPDSQVGLLIGKNGTVFNEIHQTSGAKLQVSQKGDLVPNTQNRRVHISGTVQSVHNAHILIIQKLSAANSQAPAGQQSSYYQR
eukprot:GHVL01006858.1.p1 GENE.GHVL01006858.1~~GHVL01006858.1.p1  ORF type:complete len:349 (+),score=65.45 GHVL01006858.1:47-1093(+)